MKTNSFGQEVTPEMEISALQNEVKHKVEEIHSLLAQLAACAAGPWRTDVENAPGGEWVMTRDAGPFSEWRKGKRDGNVWTGADYNPIDTPIAFAVPNPPQVTT